MCPEHLQNNPMNNSELAGSEFGANSGIQVLKSSGLCLSQGAHFPGTAPRNLRRIVFLLTSIRYFDAALALRMRSFFSYAEIVKLSSFDLFLFSMLFSFWIRRINKIFLVLYS
ncbi:hypothetical protein CEXT_508391 [Caerostris extrusa]|uniref:Uncharacterized protein n=1 Tax=Caerostris extrusa TaxID=172846 RepID=A0AAV4WPX4_CAEEX|nr:hypothetical protein CEXT_508391 [Caerostris extrusa]